MNRLTKKIDEGFYVSNAPSTDYLKYKLGKLEDIEEYLECPLEAVFQALEKGIRYFNGQYYITISKNTYDRLMLDWENKTFIVLTEPMPYSNDDWHWYGEIPLKEHGKTWWIMDEIKQCPLLLVKEVIKNGGYIKSS